MAPVRCWIGQTSPEDDQVDGKVSVGDLKKQMGTKKSCDANCLDVICCGQKLNDDVILEKYPNFNESTIFYVVDKRPTPTSRSVIPPPDEAESLIFSLQTTVVDQHHRATLARIVSSGETLQNLIDCIPGLREDTVAQGILKDPYLLAHWATDDRVMEHFSKHPCLYEACQWILNSLHAEVVRQSGTGMDAPMLPPPPPPGVDVGDPFESDEDETDQSMDAGDAVGHGVQITPQQLAAALAAAAGGASSTGQSQQAARTTASSNNPPSASPFITPNMLQAAMQQVLAANTQQPVQMQEQLDQLRDMGFVNADENARALRNSNGDVMAAVEFIIAERERQEQGFGLD